MKTYLLNAAWLIIVSLLANNTYSQLTLNPENNVEIDYPCDELANMPLPIVSSECEGELEYSFEDKTYSGGCLGTIERIWLIRDNCNNEITFQQFIRLQDEKAPILSSYPQSVSVLKDQIPDTPEISARDNCSENVKVEFSEKKKLDENRKLISISRSWMATDKCGNTVKHEQIIAIKK
jgi:hypothetical protein